MVKSCHTLVTEAAVTSKRRPVDEASFAEPRFVNGDNFLVLTQVHLSFLLYDAVIFLLVPIACLHILLGILGLVSALCVFNILPPFF
jgi:hypothetical protein